MRKNICSCEFQITEVILNAGIRNCFILLDDTELQRFGVRNLIPFLSGKGVMCHQSPCELGMYPGISAIMEMIREIFYTLGNGQKSIIL